ncbi:MAG: hypothetical protein HY211_02860 [Candidatus Omnitrophica bacterium]|nr:hypothetical protein [Candidatus Omnitrophota bacterium]
MSSQEKTAVVLIGHGAPATDCPPQLVGELMGLEWGGPDLKKRAEELDAKIRDWPRHPGNDPYKVGLEKLASELRRMLPSELFAIGYNEFCRPSIPEALEQVIRQGATRVLVIPSMLTPGGLHSEVDIPRALQKVRETHPAIEVEYLWPFDLKEVAALLSGQIQKALEEGTARSTNSCGGGSGSR